MLSLAAFALAAGSYAADYEYLDISGQDFSSGDYSGKSFQNATATGTNFSNSNLNNAVFRNAIVTDADFSGATINGVDFIYATGITREQVISTKSFADKDLSGVSFTFLNLSDAFDFSGYDFSGFNLNGTRLDASKIADANFTGADLRNANFNGSTDASGADFTDAKITGASFRLAENLTFDQIKATQSYKEKDLSGVSLSTDIYLKFSMEGESLAGFNLQGAILSNVVMKNVDFSGADLTGATINTVVASGSNPSNLDGANFTGAIVKGITFNKSFTLDMLKSTKSYADKDLGSIDVSGGQFSNEDFSCFNLEGANFTSSTKLDGAKFVNANLKGSTFGTTKNTTIANADFTGANLQNATFKKTTMTGANFTGADMRGATLTSVTGSGVYKNTIDTDGTIKNLSMTSSDDVLLVREHEEIAARITETGSMTGNSKIILENAAVLSIEADFLVDSAIEFAVSDDDRIGVMKVAAGVTLSFGEGSQLVLDIPDSIAPVASEIMLIILGEDAQISGWENVEIVADGWGAEFTPTSGICLVAAVPEPSVCAAIAALIALGIAYLRRRK